MTLNEMIEKLGFEVRLAYEPTVLDSERVATPNPTPWSCARVDYRSCRGTGKTPDEAAGNMLRNIVEEARSEVREYTDCATRANGRLEELISKLGL